MAKTLEEAAKTLVHYINTLAGPDGLSPDSQMELQDVVEAFREADEALEGRRPC
jgi:hypothetical protein